MRTGILLYNYNTPKGINMEIRPKTEVECEACGTSFMKENRQINRTNKNNGVHCCSRECTNGVLKTRRRVPMTYNLRN